MSTKHIQSRDNAQYKSLLKLSNSARERRIHHQALLDGAHLIEAYGASGGRVQTLIASESGLQRAEIARLYDTTPADSKVVLADRLFQEIAAVVTPSGILALIPTPVHEGVPKLDMNCMFLENIQDAGNVGSMLRIAAAAAENDCADRHASGVHRFGREHGIVRHGRREAAVRMRRPLARR